MKNSNYVISQLLDQAPVSRQAKLEAFLVLTGLSMSRLADIMDIDRTALSKAMNGERPYAYIIDGLVSLGIPRTYLPEPVSGGRDRMKRIVAERIEKYRNGTLNIRSRKTGGASAVAAA